MFLSRNFNWKDTDVLTYSRRSVSSPLCPGDVHFTSQAICYHGSSVSGGSHKQFHLGKHHFPVMIEQNKLQEHLWTVTSYSQYTFANRSLLFANELTMAWKIIRAICFDGKEELLWSLYYRKRDSVLL